MDFGKLLKRLRSSRGLQQTELARLAGVTVFTISRGERSRECPWKPSTATDIFQALEDTAPLSHADKVLYFEACNLHAIADSIEQNRPTPSTPASPPERKPPVATGPTDPDEQTLHEWIQRLADQRGAAIVLNALEGLAAGWDIDLPPRRRHDSRSPAGRWLLLREQHESDGYRLSVYDKAETPTKPSPQPKRPAKPTHKANRRSA